MEQLRCIIEHVVYSNPENGYSVFSVDVDKGKAKETLVGTFNGVGIGTTLVCDGEWKMDKKYGRQFVVETWVEELPSTVIGMERYLGSGLINGIGPIMAKRIVKHFGQETFDVIDNTPDRLLEVPGIGKERKERIMASWERQKGVKDVMMFLQGHGVSTAYAVRIYKHYGKESIEKVKENPYRLADDVFGIGFKMADQIASNLGYTKNDLRRCKAGVIYTLNQLAIEGHCYAERKQLVATSKELLEVEEKSVKEAIEHLTFEQNVIVEDNNIYLPMYYYSEVGVAKKIRLLLSRCGDLSKAKLDMEAIGERTEIEYDEVQVQAIEQAVRSKVMVLTGGPGTGKTTTVLGIIAALEAMKKKILCAAPTGRAAKRMSEATGKEAMTIHRMLEYNPEVGFGRNYENPLDGDVLIVDESSMIDIMLMNALIKAIPLKMRLILVGDIDQLPSVGAGNVLRDIIDSDVVPVVRLTKIFRQAQTSRIVTNAHKINHGDMPDVSNGKDTDFFFIKEEDAPMAAEKIVGIVSRRIPKAYGYGIGDIQVLVPMKNGASGTTALNIALQQAVNPEGQFIQVGQYKYRKGDKVMQIRNNYNKNVFNGDVGTVTAIDTEEHTMTVLFDKEVEYDSGDMVELTLAYATTIHKSQGSEYPVVVMPLLMSHYVMLQRNLVYTGITRAKKLCIIVGSPKALAMAVRNMTVLKRNTKLKDRLREVVV